MSKENLVYTLPVQKRPAKIMLYGNVGFGTESKTGPICRVETNGKVYLLGDAKLVDVQMVLAGFPYNLEFEELKKVRY